MDGSVAFVVADHLPNYVRRVAVPHPLIILVNRCLSTPTTKDVDVDLVQLLELPEVQKRADPSFFEIQSERGVVDEEVDAQFPEIWETVHHKNTSLGPFAVGFGFEFDVLWVLWFAVGTVVELQPTNILQIEWPDIVEERNTQGRLSRNES